jgi:hypothetical protein
MNREEFERLALIYGADLARWPTEYRAAAERLLEVTPELSQTIQGARHLDSAVAAQRSEIAEDRLARLKAATLQQTRAQRPIVTPAPRWQFAGWVRGARAAAIGREASWIVAGVASAACAVAVLQVTRPVAQTQPSAIVALLEYEGSGVLEALR